MFDLDNGRIRYFGDHRADHTVPVGTTQGNAVLLETLAEHPERSGRSGRMVMDRSPGQS
ncbi:hypothetical protein AB0B13_15350 [Streptomyces sp. NPDC042898]|uniref:hypothetical protein n=1 Tax=Streptomyces sp. NPDC042898 TaxID=3154334 RepID=UPI0033FA2EA1